MSGPTLGIDRAAPPSPARGRRGPREAGSDEGAGGDPPHRRSRLFRRLPHPTSADAEATFSRKREKGSRLAAIILALLLAQGAAPVRADTDPAPYETVRALTALQDRIASGDGVSQAAHARAILRAGRAFAKAKPATWADRRNARALVVYLFSGGDARAIAAAVPASAIAPGLEDLYAGALAYGRGDDATARAKLMPLDPRAQPGGLGGHLALIQATLAAPDDPAKAVGLLDVARLLEPGSLVEEAALRKEMSLIGTGGDLDKFALLTRRYLGAFPHSTYAENFRVLVARTAMDIGAGDTADSASRLTRLMGGLEQGERRRLYLAIAHEATLAGRTTMATLTGDEARRLARPGDADAARALLYYGAAAIVGPRYEAGKAALAQADRARLGAADRALLASALAVSESIRQPLNPAQGAAEAKAEAAIATDIERSLARADDALKATDSVVPR